MLWIKKKKNLKMLHLHIWHLQNLFHLIILALSPPLLHPRTGFKRNLYRWCDQWGFYHSRLIFFAQGSLIRFSLKGATSSNIFLSGYKDCLGSILSPLTPSYLLSINKLGKFRSKTQQFQRLLNNVSYRKAKITFKMGFKKKKTNQNGLELKFN